MDSLFSNLDSLRIGSVDFVSPDEIKATLDTEAPNNVALNAGVPRPFPRINSYVLIPVDNGSLVAQLVWITVEKFQYPKSDETRQDYEVINLPSSSRKMSLNPIGVLRTEIGAEKSDIKFTFTRGIDVFPTVGDPVLLPTEKQLKSIIESGGERRVDIGTCPMAGNAIVSVDPNRLFSRHLAILGNTGSGKSCSVAGIIRWSIEAAQKASGNNPGTHFIILDPNGEYAAAFKDMPGVGLRVYGAEEDVKNQVCQLRVPVWLWNSSEWATFTQASSRAQRPTLIQALRSLRAGKIDVLDLKSKSMRDYLRTIVSTLSSEIKSGAPSGKFPKPKNFNEKIKKLGESIEASNDYTKQQNGALSDLKSYIGDLNEARGDTNANFDFRKTETDKLLLLAETAFKTFCCSDEDDFAVNEDIPVPFTGASFLKCIEATAEMMGTSEYAETMIIRIRSLLNDPKLKKVISDDDQQNPVLFETWLDEYICPSHSTGGSITVIDLSFIPAELTHIIASVIARITLEALQHYRRVSAGQTLPTVLVMEEAHTFIKRYSDSESESENASKTCTKIFEKIAREGRKFGLGLVLSSQRPSELSPTVLSQCNSFLLHRISNDRDQELVSKLVPDNLRGLLRELPSLPARNAILLGWASEIPVQVQMNYLEDGHRPKSDDPDFWDAWTEKRRKVKWSDVVDNCRKEK